MDDAGEDTESVLAAYRERKRQQSEAQQGGSAEAAQAMAASAAPPPRQSPAPQETSPPAHFTFHHPAPSAPAPSPAPGLAAPAASASAEPRTSALATAPPQPSSLATAPGATLSALGPALRLSDALLKDRTVSVKGSPKLRAAGVVLVLLGLGLLVLDRRAAAFGADVPEYRLAGLGLAAVGCVLVLAGMAFPRNRRLAVRLAASQREEWKRVQGESRRLVWMTRAGLGLAVAGLLGLAAAYTLKSLAGIGLAGFAAAAGLALLAAAAIRRSVARRLYVQTLVLSGLEASGLGGAAPDERVQPVILALDRLLGALPEAEVQEFLSTPQAKAYLELVDEATRSQRGP